MSVRYPYKVFPVAPNDIRFPKGTQSEWLPTLNVSIIYNHAQTKRFEAMVDSGSPTCLFHANIGKAIGIKLAAGDEGPLGGVIGGASGKVYYHQIKLCLATHMIDVVAGFSEGLSVGAILGRAGLFEHYKITFDPCNDPPGLELERFYRA